MVTIANPIYDSVFKFLMEDMRVARTILSALLKQEIIEVEVRPHEYANSQRDTLSMFRIDFGAKVRKDDGTVQLVLIEVQKTWLETETLRFRQYLGVQYERKDNINPTSKEGYAIPMVAIYILGHKVGDIEEPVIYVHPNACDYDGRPVTKGLPDPFVDSLTHHSIIVQIPRLKGKVNNRLYRLLSVFDQSYHSKLNQHFLDFDDAPYQNDNEMKDIIHRLLIAASDADTRMDMNVEDEYYSVIEKRDTEILLNAKKIAEQKVMLAQQEEQLSQKNAQLSQKDAQLSQKDAQLSQKNAQLSQKDAQLSQKDAQLSQQEAIIRNAVQSMAQNGMDDHQIAAALNIAVEKVLALK